MSGRPSPTNSADTPRGQCPARAGLAAHRDLLNRAGMFEGADEAVLDLLASRMEDAFYPPGAVVISQGDPTNHLFVIADGKAEVSVKDGQEQITVATLEPGEVFGEMGFLALNRNRQATVIAVTELRVAQIDGKALDGLIAERPELRKGIAKIAENRQEILFIKRFSPFETLQQHEITALRVKMRPVTVEAGTALLREGEPGTECYLLLSGTVEVVLADQEQGQRRAATLWPGCILGEGALLTEEPCNATVCALERCTLLSLQRQDLIDVLRDNELLSAQLRQLIQQRDRPRRVEGVLVQEQTSPEGALFKVLKHPSRPTYFKLSKEGWFVWERLDGNHTLKDLTLEFLAEWKAFAPDQIADIVAGLATAGLTQGRVLREDVVPHAPHASWWQGTVQAARSIMEFHVEWQNTDAVFSALYRNGGYLLFTKPAQVVFALVAILGFLPFFLSGERVRPFLDDPVRSRPLLLIVYLGLHVALVLHEMGHGLATKHFGRHVGGAGVGWYWFGAVAFVDTSDMWLADRWQRIAVSLAGPYTNLLLGSIVSLCAWLSPSMMMAAALWQLALISYVNCLFNMNPFLEFDGYFVLSDWLERPSLRRRAFQWIGGNLLGAMRDVRELRRHWFDIAYGALSVVFTLLMAFSTVLVYRSTLEPHLKLILPAGVMTLIPWAIVTILLFLAAILMIDEMSRPK